MVGIRASTPTTKNEATTHWMNELAQLLTVWVLMVWFAFAPLCGNRTKQKELPVTADVAVRPRNMCLRAVSAHHTWDLNLA